MLALRPITCKPYSKNRIRILCSAVVFAFVSQVVTFAMFGREICKENDCFLGGGGILSIIAAVLYLISAVTVWKIPEPANNAIQVNEMVLPDGTMVTEKTTISPDGTKTIEKTIIILVYSRGGIEKPQQTGDASVDAGIAVA